MADRDCHDEPAAVWVCACSPEQSFCVTCLLRHVQDPGAHSVTHRGPTGQYFCGMCKGVTDRAVSCRYPVCLCTACVEHLSVGAAPAGEEIEAKVAEAAWPGPIEEGEEQVAKVQGAQSSVRALLTQKRNDARQRSFDNMNCLEEVISQAILLDQELTLCKDRLRTTEAQLAERNAEAQGGRGGADPAQFAGFLERIETVSRDNERLKTENWTLTNRIQEMEKKLGDSIALSQQIKSLSNEITNLKAELEKTMKEKEENLREKIEESVERTVEKAVEQVQGSLQEQQQATARLAAMKVSDVFPLVAHLQVDNPLLNRDTLESLFKLASLSISYNLNSSEMCVATRVSLSLAKLLGPCEEMSKFSKSILTLLEKTPEKGVSVLRNFDAVHLRAKDEATFTEFIKTMMEHVESRECQDSMSISGRISERLSWKKICEFTLKVFNYFKQGDQLAWKGALLELPLKWKNAQLAEISLGKLLDAVLASNFSREHLALVKLLRLYHPVAEEPLLPFMGKAAALLSANPPRDQLHAYILEATSQAESSLRLSSEEGQTLCMLVTATKELVHEQATAGELEKLRLLVKGLNPESKHHDVMAVFVRLFAKFRSEEKLRAFALAMLEWLFPVDKVREDVAFAQLVLGKLAGTSDLEGTATLIGTLLREILKSTVPNVFEECLAEMLKYENRLKVAVQLCVAFSYAQVDSQQLIGSWNALLGASADKGGAIDTAAALLESGLQESLFASLHIIGNATAKPQASATISEMLSVLRASVPERAQVTALLSAAAKTPNAALSDLAVKCLLVWRGGRARGARDSCNFCLRALQELAADGVGPMLDNVITAFAEGNVALESVSTLLEIYVADASTPETLSSQLTALKKVRAEPLGPLLAKLKAQPMQPQCRTLLIHSLLEACEQGDVQTVTREMDALIDIPETTQLLEVLCRLQEAGVKKDFLEAVRRTPNTAKAAVQLATMFLELEAQGVQEANVSASVRAALQRSEETSRLLPSVMALLQNRVHRMGALCIKVIGELGNKGPGVMEHLEFVTALAKDLLDSAQPNAVMALCNAILAAIDEAQRAIVDSLKQNRLQLKDKLVDLLNRVQDRVTLQKVDAVMQIHTQTRELVNVQTNIIRFFDFNAGKWGQNMRLSKDIQCNSSTSSYIILDDTRVLCCGGTSQAGYNPGRLNSGSIFHTANQGTTVAYILSRADAQSRDWAVADLPSMNGARAAHGIIYISSNNTVYVFGGCK